MDLPWIGPRAREIENKKTLGCLKKKPSCFSHVEKKHEGECTSIPPACSCPSIYRPVCGLDNLTYDNECSLKCRWVQCIASLLPEIIYTWNLHPYLHTNVDKLL